MPGRPGGELAPAACSLRQTLHGLLPGGEAVEHLEQVLEEIDFRDRTGSGHLMARLRRLFHRGFRSTSSRCRTGWKSPRYDALLRSANLQTDRAGRAELLREAEHLLIAVEVPVVPLYFYSGFTWFDENRIEGIYPNILDEHPIQNLAKKISATGRSSRRADASERLVQRLAQLPPPPMFQRSRSSASPASAF